MLHFCLKLCNGENKTDAWRLTHPFHICKAELATACLVYGDIWRDYKKKKKRLAVSSYHEGRITHLFCATSPSHSK